MTKIFTTRVKTNLNGVLQMTQMVNGIMMTGDNAANQIVVELYNDFTKVSIPSETKIIGYFIRSDGYTIEVDGSVNEEGEAVVVIPETAYQVSGSMSIAIRLFENPRTDTYRGYYAIVIRRGYFDSETHEFVEVDDPTETIGPHGETIENHAFTSSEFIQVTDPEQTVGPNGEPVVERTFDTWGTKIVIATLTCYVRITESDSLIDEYHHIPDVQELLAYIDKISVFEQEAESAENERSRKELARIVNEEARQVAEENRVTEERVRTSNEEDRILKESARQDAEVIREANTEEALQRVNEAISGISAIPNNEIYELFSAI